VIVPVGIGVGDGGMEHVPQNSGRSVKFGHFSGKYHVKFRNFVI